MTPEGFAFSFADTGFVARPSGALYWPQSRTLVVSDLHLCKSTRYVRQRHILLPPYEIEETLNRLEREIALLSPETVISLGDSFDDQTAISEISVPHLARLDRLTRQHDWIWITGNHDPISRAPPFGGVVRSDFGTRPIFRHIRGDGPDVSGHLHLVYPLAGRRFRSFVVTDQHLIMPAFGSYTGGLSLSDPSFRGWTRKGRALLCGKTVFEVPLP